METASRPLERNERAEGPPRILVVEDERIVAMSLWKHLQALGYEVAGQVASGQEAIQLAGDLRPSLVLMDISLEGPIDGVQAAAEIRKRFHLPVVYLTAYSNADVLQRAKVTEPFGYILKPYEDRELHVVIETALYKHQMERRQEERERWVASTLTSIGDGVIAADDAGRVTFMNPTAERLTGWTAGEARGRLLEEVMTLLHEWNRQTVASPLRQAMRDQVNVPLANHTILVSRDRTERPIDDCATPITDEQGGGLGGVMVFRDVTRRKEAEMVLSKLAAIVSSSADAIIGLTADETIYSWNPGAERLFGYLAAEVAGQPISILLPSDRSEESRWIASRVRQGERVEAFSTVRRRKDGAGVEVLVSAAPIRDGGGQVVGTALIVHDVTHTRQLEEQYRQAQKMEAVGRLAGGVAHDFNNLLTVINGYSSILLGVLQPFDPSREMVEHINRAGERAATLTQQLLAYSRRQLLHPRVVDLNELATGLAAMLVRMIGEDVQLRTIPAGKPCLVKTDPNQFEQVIMNLAVNARDAMPNGGQLTIETAHVDLDETTTREFAEVQPGPYVLLSVRDTGIGMDRSTLAHIFDPFFTTKEQGKGTGLGLAMIYGIVKQSSGHIHVASEPGRGAVFNIYLPRVQGGEGPTSEAAPAAAMPGGSETLLLVEDEEDVRTLAQFILEKVGYTVLSAANGVEALEISARHPDPIHLLATDVVMPGMGGRQLAETLQSQRPDLRVLFMSGYTEDDVLRGVSEAKTNFLAKPFTTNILTRKIREVLDLR